MHGQKSTGHDGQKNMANNLIKRDKKVRTKEQKYNMFGKVNYLSSIQAYQKIK